MKTKSRNITLAALLVALFAATTILLQLRWMHHRPFAVIVFLCPELSPSHLAAAQHYGGPSAPAELESWPGLLLLQNQSLDRAAADDFAAASELATGQPALSGPLPSPHAPASPPTLLDLARQSGRATGFLTQGSLATSALTAFAAPGTNLTDPAQTATAWLHTIRPDLLLGGGLAAFLPELKGGLRKDARDLLLEARQSGYDIARTAPELASTPTWRAPRLLGLFAPDHMQPAASAPSFGQPTLPEMTASAIRLLQYNQRGYLLIIEAALPALAAENNDGEALLDALLELQSAALTARQYAGKDAIILVLGTSTRGGMCLHGFSKPGTSGLAVLAPSAEGIPAITWSTGPGGPPGAKGPRQPAAFPVSPPAHQVTWLLGFWHAPPHFAGPTGFSSLQKIHAWLAPLL